MLHEMLSIIPIKELFDFMVRNFLKQLKFSKIKFEVQSEYFLIESTCDDVFKLNIFKFELKSWI